MYNYYYARQPPLFPPSYSILALLISALFEFLQLKYQGKEASPFQTHPKSTGVAIASLILYYLAYEAQLSHLSATYACLVSTGVAFFGSLSWVSLASILLPDSLESVLFLVHMLFWTGVSLGCRVQMIWKWLVKRVSAQAPMLPTQIVASDLHL
ncbi:hypothetical protein NMG60_11030266 [Bertholletia excelsa]